jgi:hypothetical protein
MLGLGIATVDYSRGGLSHACAWLLRLSQVNGKTVRVFAMLKSDK